ncbi:MAG: acyl-CoA dehydrogenase family protein [Oligoflexales bacterium]
MQIKNFFEDNDNLMYHLRLAMKDKEFFALLSDADKDAIGAEQAVEYAEQWEEALKEVGRVCAHELQNNQRKIDENPVYLKEQALVLPEELKQNLELLKDIGLAPFGVSPEYGGLGAPYTVEMAALEMLNRACPSTTLNCTWYSSIAHVIEKFGSEELSQRFIPQIASGKISGNMALSEPNTGSDLGSIQTYAEEQEDGTWLLSGCKRFITNGTADISLVLAKTTKGAEGLGNLSLYLCPRTIESKENIHIEKLEHKVALNGSATAELVYNQSVGWLIGKPNEGFHYMLQLMNDSRIGVAFQALGLMQATYEMASEYTSQRQAWGKPLAQHELVASMLMDMDVEIRAARSFGYKTAHSRSIVVSGEKKLKGDLSFEERSKVEKLVRKHQKKLRIWTPLLKYWVTERAVWQSRQALQLLGGYGFTKEYDAERWLRESLVYPIYEGTSQIQALMCLKDTLKEVVRNPRTFIEQGLSLRIKIVTAKSDSHKKSIKIQQMLHSSIVSILFRLVKRNVKDKVGQDADLSKVIRLISADLVKFENLRPALLAAEYLCELKTLDALSQSLVCDFEDDPNYAWVVKRFLYKSLPRAEYLKSLIETPDEIVEDLLDRLDNKNYPNPQPTGTED